MTVARRARVHAAAACHPCLQAPAGGRPSVAGHRLLRAGSGGRAFRSRVCRRGPRPGGWLVNPCVMLPSVHCPLNPNHHSLRIRRPVLRGGCVAGRLRRRAFPFHQRCPQRRRAILPITHGGQPCNMPGTNGAGRLADPAEVGRRRRPKLQRRPSRAEGRGTRGALCLKCVRAGCRQRALGDCGVGLAQGRVPRAAARSERPGWTAAPRQRWLGAPGARMRSNTTECGMQTDGCV